MIDIEELLKQFERQVRTDEYDGCSEMSCTTNEDKKQTAECIETLRAEIIKAFNS